MDIREALKEQLTNISDPGLVYVYVEDGHNESVLALPVTKANDGLDEWAKDYIYVGMVCEGSTVPVFKKNRL